MVVIDTAGPRSARKAKGDGHLRRAEILEAAERIFVELGYEGATIRRIAEEVGVSSTALYMHFKDKGAILAEICDSAFAKLIDANTELTRREMDPVERVRAMLQVYMRFAIEHPHAYQLVYGPSPTLGRVRAMNTLGPQSYSLFRGAVQIAADAGRLRNTDVDEVTQVAWAAGHGIVSLMQAYPSFPWAPDDRLMPAALDALFDGIAR